MPTEDVLAQVGAADPSAPTADGALGFRVYHVDFDAGNDGNSGTSPASPWKHAPGDPQATGTAASAKLNGGDIVRFRGGVRYRGTIVLNHSGAQSKPITYTGEGYGTGRAILDGADELDSTMPCPSAAACGGATNWQNLLLVTYAQPSIPNIRFYDQLGPLFEAQSPEISDPFWQDDVDQFALIPTSQHSQILSGVLVHPALAAAAAKAPSPRLLIWVTGNQVVERPVLSIAGDTIYFDPAGVTPYVNSIRVSLLGSVSALNRPGQYVPLAAGKAVVYPRVGGGTLSIGNGRRAFDVRGRSNITISGFIFEHGTAATGSQGLGVTNLGGTLSNLTIQNNEFRHYSLGTGLGVMQLRNVENTTVRGNRIHDIHAGSGIRTGGNVSNMLIEYNSIRRVGRSGLVALGIRDSILRNNVISDIRGQHGNGLSLYLDNRNVEVSSNCVHDSVRALTFHGNHDPATVNNLQFRGNIFRTNADGRAAIYSWGKNTNGVVIENNVAISPVAGMILNGNDHDVQVHFNSGNAIGVYHGADESFDISDNDTTVTYAQSSSWLLDEQQCLAPASYGDLAITSVK